MPRKEVAFTPLASPSAPRYTPLFLEVRDQNSSSGDTETVPRRNRRGETGKLVSTPEPGVDTVFDIVERGAQKFGEASALGTRSNLKTLKQQQELADKKNGNGALKPRQRQWSMFEKGPYEWISYTDYALLVQQIGAGYRKLGMSRGDKLHIYAATSAHWLTAAHGAASQSMPIVTAYEALGTDGLKHSLLETGARAIFVDVHLLPTLTTTLKSNPSLELQWLIVNHGNHIDRNNAAFKDLDKLVETYPQFQIVNFEQLRQLGQDSPVDSVPPTREDLFAIYYTSGSTGTPKGVPIKHKAVIASIAGLDSIIGSYFDQNDSFLAFLPLAHVLELAFENAAFFWGVPIGYGSPKTLFDTYMHNCKGDLRELSPSFLIGAPATWEVIRKAILVQIEELDVSLSTSILTALSQENASCSANGFSKDISLQSTILGLTREIVGSRLRFGMSGGAPIAPSTQRFLSMTMAPLINGFGLTETMAMGALMDPMEWQLDAVGQIPSSIEMKLVTVPELGYLASHDPPQGEIWIRGDSVMEGYWRNEEETAKVIDPDGWFKTGDIGRWEPNGHVKIVDRKKNLVKTLKGEYVALEKLESIYRSAPIVKNICIYASPTRSKPIAIIVPSISTLENLAHRAGHRAARNQSPAALTADPYIQQLALQHLQALGRDAALASFEVIEGAVLTDGEDWTPMNGMTTSVGKLNRSAILTKYTSEVDSICGGE